MTFRWNDPTLVGSDLTGSDLTMERSERIPHKENGGNKIVYQSQHVQLAHFNQSEFATGAEGGKKS